MASDGRFIRSRIAEDLQCAMGTHFFKDSEIIRNNFLHRPTVQKHESQTVSIRKREITTEVSCLQSTTLAELIDVHEFTLIECKSRRVDRQVTINRKYWQSQLDDT
jgi:hypothetical protein